MKKALLGLILGFLLHKGLSAFHSYKWWSAEKACRRDVRNLTDRLRCIDETLGKYEYVGLITAYPSYTFQEWEWKY